jgi:hypothetical protein
MFVSSQFYNYFSALKLDPQWSSKQKIEKHIRENHLHFSYGNATYASYEKKYESRCYLQRKIRAIPAALLTGTIHVIYHLAKAVLYGIPKACLGEGRHFKANIYRLTRDMEEALGWLVTLFDDKRGSYLVQESLFHKECYHYFEKKQTHDRREVARTRFRRYN